MTCAVTNALLCIENIDTLLCIIVSMRVCVFETIKVKKLSPELIF